MKNKKRQIGDSSIIKRIFSLVRLTSTFARVSAFVITFLFFTLYATRYTLDVFAGVGTTKHNLSVNGPGTTKADSSSGVTEICVFCHTPHGAISTFGGGDLDHTPLWNHTLSTANYTVADWLISTVRQPDKGSRLCLSCHDGTVAIGTVVNTPGPGSRHLGSTVGTETIHMTSSGYTALTAAGKFPPRDPDLGGPNINQDAPNVPVDIRGTHPVSIALNDDLIAARTCDNYSAYLAYPTGPVKLRPTAATFNGNPGKDGKGVQCRTCHDPHNEAGYGNFFVISKSQLCVSCHKECQ